MVPCRSMEKIKPSALLAVSGSAPICKEMEQSSTYRELIETGRQMGRRLDIKGKAFHPLHMKSSVSSKGQVTLPAEARQALGLAPGTPVRFEIRDGELVLRKGTEGLHPVDRVYGILKLDRPVDNLIDEMRGQRPRQSGRRRKK